MNLLDVWLPDYQFREYHSQRVTAPTQDLWHAVKTVTPEEIRPLGWLMAIRSLPARLVGHKGRGFEKGTPILDMAVNSNFVLLDERPSDEIAFGLGGQFWKLHGGPCVDVHNAHDFAAFGTPGFVRAAVNFQVGHGVISTETRIQALDDETRRKFALYWTLIRPGSGWIRMAWLRAISRRAS